MSGLKVIRPVEVTEAVLISSTVPENDHSEWDSTTLYPKGQRVRVSAAQQVFESLIDNNLAIYPVGSSSWAPVSVTNKWRMFDGRLSTRSQASGVGQTDISVVLAPGVATAAAVFEVQGYLVRITQTNPDGTTIAAREINLRSGSVDNPYDWCFGPWAFDPQAAVSDLPYYPDALIRIDILGSTEAPAQCGAVVVGVAEEMGLPQFGAKLGIRDYSKIVEDDFGVSALVKRANAKRLELDMQLDATQLAKVYAVLSQITATLCAFIVDEDELYSALLVYGWVIDFTINLATPRKYFCSLEIGGAT